MIQRQVLVSRFPNLMKNDNCLSTSLVSNAINKNLKVPHSTDIRFLFLIPDSSRAKLSPKNPPESSMLSPLSAASC